MRSLSLKRSLLAEMPKWWRMIPSSWCWANRGCLSKVQGVSQILGIGCPFTSENDHGFHATCRIWVNYSCPKRSCIHHRLNWSGLDRLSVSLWVGRNLGSHISCNLLMKMTQLLHPNESLVLHQSCPLPLRMTSLVGVAGCSKWQIVSRFQRCHCLDLAPLHEIVKGFQWSTIPLRAFPLLTASHREPVTDGEPLKSLAIQGCASCRSGKRKTTDWRVWVLGNVFLSHSSKKKLMSQEISVPTRDSIQSYGATHFYSGSYCTRVP